LLLGSIKQRGDDRILANVFSDVFLGVVSPHLLLVNVLLEDVPEHVRIDLAIIAQGERIEMPFVLIEKGE